MSLAVALAAVSSISTLALGIAPAALVATLLSFVVDARTWVPCLASMIPGLARRARDPYPKPRVSDSAIVFLAGATQLVVGIVLA